MFNTDKINEISNKINDMIKSSPLADVEKNINALIQGAFTKMELVSREEFDVQAQLLTLTREQLILLELRVTQLEAQRNTIAK